jgi:hypothetical protein
MKTHRMIYPLTDETGILTVEYGLTVEFGFDEGEKQTRDCPGYPAHPVDVNIIKVTASLGNQLAVFTDGEELRVFNDMYDENVDGLADKIHDACFEYMKDLDEDAKEAKAEAKFQAMRDGE